MCHVAAALSARIIVLLASGGSTQNLRSGSPTWRQQDRLDALRQHSAGASDSQVTGDGVLLNKIPIQLKQAAHLRAVTGEPDLHRRR